MEARRIRRERIAADCGSYGDHEVLACPATAPAPPQCHFICRGLGHVQLEHTAYRVLTPAGAQLMVPSSRSAAVAPSLNRAEWTPRQRV